MATNILSITMAEVDTTVGNNEDWIQAIPFLQSDDVTPLSIAEITFSMQARPTAASHDVYIDASTSNGQLALGALVGGTSTDGVLAIKVPVTVMSAMQPGDYVADIVGTADGYSRVVARITMTVYQGVTR